jgi:hypothetical protein
MVVPSALQSTIQFFVKRDEQSMRKRKLRNLLLLAALADQTAGWTSLIPDRADLQEVQSYFRTRRLISQGPLAFNQVRLVYEYELRNGSSFRHEKVLIETNGEWRLHPVRVTKNSAGQ